jgi:hypothetical protein
MSTNESESKSTNHEILLKEDYNLYKNSSAPLTMCMHEFYWIT